MLSEIKKKVRSIPAVYIPYYDYVERSRRKKYEIAKANGRLVNLVAADYKKYTNQDLHIPPISYTEKMQFAKVFAATEEKGLLSDKVYVRKWVEKKLGEDISIPLVGVWNKIDDIPWDQLPQKFVLKTNNGSGTNIIVSDKNVTNRKRIKQQVNNWMKHDFAYTGKGYEMHYSYIKPKVLVEEFLNDQNGQLNDYKFLCFDSKPCFCWVDVDRLTKHKRNIYDMDWNLQTWNQFSYGTSDKKIPKPACFDQMKSIAKILCEGFSHVRVDLYDVDNKIYFGEMTFTNGKGYEMIVPESANIMLGDLWPLEKEIDFSNIGYKGIKI